MRRMCWYLLDGVPWFDGTMALYFESIGSSNE